MEPNEGPGVLHYVQLGLIALVGGAAGALAVFWALGLIGGH